MRPWFRFSLMTTAMLLAMQPSHQAVANSFALQRVVSGLTNPVALANAGDGSNRLFIVDQTGVIRIFNGTQVVATPFLDITARVLSGGERGLLGLAFDTNYASNGFFYVFYTSRPAGEVTIARYSVSANPNVANANSELILKTQAHADFGNHNGGSLLFGPDGCLYAGIGDGGSGGDPNNNGQNLGTLLGKIIRISPSDGAPCAAAPGNPFISTPGARGEIWALGLRNPWRITFDRQTGDLLIADVGQNQREEVNFQPAGVGGRNYCWRRKEGTLIFNPDTPCTAGTPTDPVLEYNHSGGNCSITGGYRYRGSKFLGFVGTYFYADFCSGRIWAATESGGTWIAIELFDTSLNISSFGEDEAGEIYLLHLSAADGALYRLTTSRDFDSDGKSDILWRQIAGGIALWEMNGGAVKASLGVGFAGTEWTIVGTAGNVIGTGDFDGDGKADILWRQNTGGVALWEMNGSVVKASLGVGFADNSWTISGVGDFDGDGKADILWRQNTGGVALWQMVGNVVKSSTSVGFVSNEWSIAGIGDFDGDGKADILWRQNGGGVALWLMNGNVIKSSVAVGLAGNDWTVVGVGDFDGDGKADILWRQNTGGVALWEMNGGAVKASLGVGFAGTDWQIVSTGDYDADGKSDILWRQNTGGVALWEMNGNVVKASLAVGFAGTEWTIVE